MVDIQVLSEWNSWWQDGKVPEELAGKSRPKYSMLVDSVKLNEITALIGVRRSGKSTLMYQMIDKLVSEGVKPEQILFLNFEDPELMNESLEDIYTTYREKLNPDKKAYIFLDEVHRKDKWEQWIRKKYELHKENKFVVSGSNSYLLKKDYSTLITGRNLCFDVMPLSFEEFLLFRGLNIDIYKLKKGIITEKIKLTILHQLNKYILGGGFPKVLLTPENFRNKLLKQYFDDILYKDIILKHELNGQKAIDFAIFLMTNFTRLISLRNIRNSLGLSYDTTKDYLFYFKEAFLFFTIDHFSYSFKEQKTLAPKIYCIDNGLRNAVSFKFSQDLGKLAENLVLVELKRREKEVYYWKDKSEVDFIVKEEGKLTAVNVCYSEEIDDRERKSLYEFKSKHKKAKLVLITKDKEKDTGEIKYMPLWKWLLSTDT